MASYQCTMVKLWHLFVAVKELRAGQSCGTQYYTALVPLTKKAEHAKGAEGGKTVGTGVFKLDSIVPYSQELLKAVAQQHCTNLKKQDYVPATSNSAQFEECIVQQSVSSPLSCQCVCLKLH